MSASSAALIPAPIHVPIHIDVQTLQFPVEGRFAPDPLTVSPDETITLRYLGTGSVQITILGSNSTPYALFKDSSNPYSVSSRGTDYQIRTETPLDTTYTIVFETGDKLGTDGIHSISVVPIRGTINVKKPG
jgi:hypothetical protein